MTKQPTEAEPYLHFLASLGLATLSTQALHPLWTFAFCTHFLLIIWRVKDLPSWMILFLLIPFFIAKPSLSDDSERYIWEGFVQTEGFSPYVYPPQTLMDKGLTHPSNPQVAHPHMSTIYPPLSLLLFRIAHHIHPSIFGWKILILILSIPLFFSQQTRWLLCSPLFLIEGIWNGHIDVLAFGPLFLLTKNLASSKTGLYLGSLISLKIMPAIWVPTLLRNQSLKKATLSALIAGLMVIFTYLPFLEDGTALFDSFLTYSKTWSFNNPFYIGLKALIGEAFTRILLPITWIIFIALQWRRSISLPCLWGHMWIGMIFFSPTVYPWYFAWLFPIFGKNKALPLHLIYAASTLSYLILVRYKTEQVWQESWLWLIPEWTLILVGYRWLLKDEK